MIASNSDGVRNTVGDSFRLTLPPTFYQTRWFLAFEIIAAALVFFLTFRIRITRAKESLNAHNEGRLAERDRIARELHDTLLRGFNGVMLRLQTGVELIPFPEPAKAILQDALDRADTVLVEGRSRVRNLHDESLVRPKLSVGLEQTSLELRIGDIPSCALIAAGLEGVLNPVAYDEIFAIGREALANASHHANASEIVVELRYASRYFVLVCSDNGCGIPSDTQKAGRAAVHYGLAGMKGTCTQARC